MRNMKTYIIASLALIIPGATFAGGSQGGGTPPAMEQLLREDFGAAGIYRDIDGKIRIAANRPLGSLVNLSASELNTRALRVAPEQLSLLDISTQSEDVLGDNGLGGTLYYKPTPGTTLDSVTLLERRAAARAAVGK